MSATKKATATTGTTKHLLNGKPLSRKELNMTLDEYLEHVCEGHIAHLQEESDKLIAQFKEDSAIAREQLVSSANGGC